ncbi:MAG: class II glutamine amidotransferase [Solirubrobacteraceae bacterium]
MCRLFARVADEVHPATFGLLEASDSLAAQSRREPDGYGIATFDHEGRPHVIKRAKAAYLDARFPAEAHELRSRIFVAHIRFATNGSDSERNTHPFVRGGMVFAHNGVVGGLDRLEGRLRPEYLDGVGGETDSERVFALVSQEIDGHGGDVAAGLTAAASWIAAELPLYALNVLLARSDELWALRYPATHDLLWIDHRATPPPLSAHDRRHRLRVGVGGPVRGIGVASEPVGSPEGWRLLASGELLHVGPDLEPTVTRVLPDPPAHPLSLEDLGQRAVAAQREH